MRDGSKDSGTWSLKILKTLKARFQETTRIFEDEGSELMSRKREPRVITMVVGDVVVVGDDTMEGAGAEGVEGAVFVIGVQSDKNLLLGMRKK